ncbi:MAG: gluconate 2-dehydrogenase subunit 3 family protein [Deltaproteobacteria bacterium]|nr:MAG: gluconate 2-dehydrogenase subunit 3 family protein [Deltaproteobacteria bacterium]
MSEDTRGFDFSPAEQRALARVLDAIIPPSDDGRLPGAGELGVARYLEGAVQKTPELRPVIAAGLAAADALARGRGADGFAALSAADARDVLNELATREPAFLPGLVFHTYAGYYQHDRVFEALGLEARPPHPKGYETEANDLTLLDPVRRRRRLYR